MIQGMIVGQLRHATAIHELEQRLARWLTMSHDSVSGDTMNLTQEFFAEMLGTARPSVTLAAGALQRNGSIEYGRGKISHCEPSRRWKVLPASAMRSFGNTIRHWG